MVFSLFVVLDAYQQKAVLLRGLVLATRERSDVVIYGNPASVWHSKLSLKFDE